MSDRVDGPATGLAAVLIEAFTQRPCSGNGAAVVLLQRPLSTAAMQAVAASLRQSETAFLLRRGEDWLLRWFTPQVEVRLCGHATLAALLALGHWRCCEPGEAIRFHTRSGLLEARLQSPPRAMVAGEGTISLPAGELIEAVVPEALRQWLERHLGSGPEAFWRSQLGYAVALLPAAAPLAEMPSPAAALDAELAQGLVLMQACARQQRSADDQGDLGSPSGAPLPSRQDLEYRADYRLRFFAPGLGIPEDPVTGSAHALVAPWWERRLGRSRLVGWQCSDRPGGVVSEGGPSGMIRLSGFGVLLWDGHLNLPVSDCLMEADWSLPA